MSRVTVDVVQHAASETPGLIAEVLRARGIALNYVRPFRGDKIPRQMGRHAGLLVMGGPMGVYECQQHPFLDDEIRLIKDALRHDRPILGVCLGSQLLAAALGASITSSRQKEIGWHRVALGLAATHDNLWHGVPESFHAFHWRGDIFELPAGATSLAWSKLTDCQAFRYGRAAYGLLFHLEATSPIVARMTRRFRQEMSLAGVAERSVLDGVAEHLPGLQAIGRSVFGRWAVLLDCPRLPETARHQIQIKRVYDPAVLGDGARFLVDRLWPRGVKRDALRLECWLKDLAPSDALRRWFSHDSAKWPEFRRRYFAELDARPEGLQLVPEKTAVGPVTLLFGATDVEHNNAIALREYLATRKHFPGHNATSQS